MNTFEAIGILKEYTGYKGDKWEVSMTAEDIKEFDEIVYLLQRGEAYEQMWEKFKKEYSHCYIKDVENVVVSWEMVEDIVNYHEQKYFPKDLPVGKEAKK